MKEEQQRYTEDNFDNMDWHDDILYKLLFVMEQDLLILDIDHCEGKEDDKYIDIPCLLKFKDVSRLKINIDWGECALEMRIGSIKRTNERLTPNGKLKYWDWEIEINWPSPGGSLSFASTGFDMLFSKNRILSTESESESKEREKYFWELYQAIIDQKSYIG